jgi:hypothetical protein
METSMSRDAWRAPLAALLLAVVLSLAWTLRGWHDLAVLRLPDTDDMVRLQQIRDWIGGQAFGDLAQHRLGALAGAGDALVAPARSRARRVDRRAHAVTR